MNIQTRISLVVGLVIALALGGFFLLTPTQDKVAEQDHTPAVAADSTLVVGEGSHVLGEPGSSEVTFVEFLDFQCPACAAMHPVVADLREKYEGEVTFVQRQFPLPSHPNAVGAALAAEAAANQDKLDEMSSALFEAQAVWSPLVEDEAADAFRDMAAEIGLDLARYDTDVASPATRARVDQDVKDGDEAGVRGTPSLFVNGYKLEPRTTDDIAAAIDRALDGKAPAQVPVPEPGNEETEHTHV